jgi:alpha-mannosidase
MVSYANLAGKVPAEFSGAGHAAGFALSTLKKAEDGKGYIARGYAFGRGASWPRLLEPERWQAQLVNLKEDPLAGSANAELKPFEIRTVRLRAR